MSDFKKEVRIWYLSFATPLAFLLITTLAACVSQNLSEKPPQLSLTPTFATEESTIGAQVSIAVADLTGLVNDKIPKTFSAGGNGGDACVVVGRKVCVGTQYQFTANAGTITVSTVGEDTVRVSVPVDFSGYGGFRGDLAPIIKVDKKNFKGGMLIHVDLTPRIDDKWCPTFNPRLSYAWTTNPRVEIVSHVWVDISGHVSNKVDEKLPEIASAALSAVDCNVIRREIQKIYGSRTFPVELPGKLKVHVNVTPSDIGFSGIQADPQALKFSVTLKAKVDVSDTAITPTAMALPPLKTIPVGISQMKIAIPVRASYETLTASVRGAVAGKTFVSNTPAGNIKVTINSLEIYPSGDRLVIGMNLKADLPSHWLDVSGDLYLFAKPVVEGQTKVQLVDIGFSRKFDNDLWNAATALLEGHIMNEIRKAAVFDFTAEIGSAKEALQAELKNPLATLGVVISADDVSIGLGRLAIAGNELAIEGLFSAKTVVVAKP